jgi:formylglycine-generating enzyme required for sulfatase activity
MSARHRPARRAAINTEAWLTTACLLLAAGFGPGRAAESAPVGSTNRPVLGSVLGVERLPNQDVLILRDGSRLAGTLASGSFDLRTVYGRLTMPAERIAGIERGQTPVLLDVVVSVAQDRFSGLLEGQPFTMKLSAGDSTNVRPERVLKLIRRGRTNELDGLPRRQFVRLRNGDHFTGRALSDNPQVAVGRTNLTVELAAIASIHFARDQRSAARLELRNGETVEGIWPAEDLVVDLDVSPRLTVYVGSVDAIYCQDGVRPAEFAGWGQEPRTGAGPPADAEPPGLRIPGLRWILPGRFLMGSPAEESGRDLDEGPQTQVTLTRGFWIGTHEVTQAEYKAVMGANPSQFVDDPQAPVEKVSWREARDYCEKLTRRQGAAGSLPAGFAFRLPTEAEWEYACRAGTTSRFSHGDDPEGRQLEEFAWFTSNADSTTHPVGTRKPNPWGLHDLHGNVMEWCLDAATSSLPGGQVRDYVASEKGPLRIARGGSWLYGAKFSRSANRDTYTETTRCSDLGFRVVLAPDAGQR